MQNYQINDKNVSNKQSLINCSQYKKFLPFCFYHLKGLLTKVTCYATGITKVKEKNKNNYVLEENIVFHKEEPWIMKIKKLNSVQFSHGMHQ